MRDKVSVKLIVSEYMTKMVEKGKQLESRVIRFPKKTRDILKAKRTHIEIGVGDKGGIIKLEIRKAYKEDMSKLKKMIETKKISDKDAAYAGFVSRNIWHSVQAEVKKKDENIWVSDSVSANVTIGSDPEFGIYEEGELFRADYVDGLSFAGKVGHDGTPVEIRPDGSSDHVKVVKEIERLLKEDSKAINKFDWRAIAGGMQGGVFRPFGGHIHLGRPGIVNVNKQEMTFRAIADALNDLVAVPLVNIDIHFGAERRTRYGNPTASDAVRFGDGGRWEWRVPSGVIIASPGLMEAVLGTTKACVESIYSMMGNDDFSDASINSLANDNGKIYKALKRMKKDNVHKLLMDSPRSGIGNELTKDCMMRLKSIKKYKDYKDSMDKFFKFIRTSPDKLDFSMKGPWLDGKKLI